MRNVQKQAEHGRKTMTVNRGMTAGELWQILPPNKTIYEVNEVYDAVITAYYFGFSVGERQGAAMAAATSN